MNVTKSRRSKYISFNTKLKSRINDFVKIHFDTKCMQRYENSTVKIFLDLLCQIVTIAGILGIIFLLSNHFKEAKKEKINIAIIEAVAEFRTAKNENDYQHVYNAFMKIQESDPYNITGYEHFWRLAESKLEKTLKNGIYTYDENVEKYLKYAASLNILPNEAADRLDEYQRLKMVDYE